jgi:hypothetical protein
MNYLDPLRPGIRDVVEVADGDDEVERTVDVGAQKVRLDELDPGTEAGKSRSGELEHRVGEIDVDVACRARLEREFADAARAAADVEDSRRAELVDHVEGQLAAREQPRAELALERMFFVIEAVKRGRLRAKVLANAPGCARRCLRRLAHS